MRLLQTIRWSRLQGASPMTSLRHLHRQCTQLPIMSVISSSSLQSPRLTFLASSRAQPLSTTSIIQPTSASTPESTSIPKSSSDQLIEAVEGHLKNSLPLPNFAALCYTLIPSVPTSANLEPLKSRQWTAIFTALASLYKKSDIHIIADQAWTLMTKDGPPPKLSRDCMWLYLRLIIGGKQIKGADDVKKIFEKLRKISWVDARMMRSLSVAMGFSLEKKRMFIEGWEAIKQGHSHYLTLFALRPSKSSDSNPLPVLNTAKDYDDFLAFFLGVYPTAAEMAKLAKSAVQEILVQKAQEGHPITLRNLGILAHLTIDVTEISRLLDTLESEFGLKPDHAIYSKCIRNALLGGSGELAVDVLERALKSDGLQYRNRLVKNAVKSAARVDDVIRIYVKTLEVDSSLDENGEVSSDVVEMMAGRVNSYNYSVESYADFKKIWTAIPDERKGQISAKAFGAAITAHLTRRNCNAAIEVYNHGKKQIIKKLSEPRQETNVKNDKDSQHNLARVVDQLLEQWIYSNVHAARIVLNELTATTYIPSTPVYRALIDASAYFSPTEIQRVLTEMRAKNVPRTQQFYTTLLTNLGKSGRLSHTILDEMAADGVSPNVYIYNTFISTFVKNGEYEKAVGLKETMRKHGIEPDATTFNIFLEGFLSRGQWDKANTLLTEMSAANIKRDIVTFNTLISAHARRDGGDPKHGAVLFNELTNPPYVLKPTLSTFTGLLRCHLALKEWAEAEKLFKSFEEHENPAFRPTSQTYDVYLRALAEESVAVINPVPVVEAIQKVLKTMGDNGVPILVSSLSALIRAAGKRKDLEEAKRYYDVFGPTTPFVDSDGVNSAMITALENAGDYAGAVAWADSKVPASGTGKAVEGGSSIGRSSTYALMVAHAKRRKGAEMEAVWKQLKRLEESGVVVSKESKGSGGYSVNEMNVFIQCYCNLGYIDKAMEMWRSAFKGGNAGKVDERRRIVKSTAASKGLVDRFGVDRITVSLIVDIVGAHGTRAQLEAVWEEIKEAGFPMDLNNWISYLESLARLGFDGEVVETVKREMNGLKVTEKVFWSTLPLMRNREESKRLWGVLKENYGGLEKGVRVKMANYLTENPWLDS